jgi:hypothetical protein
VRAPKQIWTFIRAPAFRSAGVRRWEFIAFWAANLGAFIALGYKAAWYVDGLFVAYVLGSLRFGRDQFDRAWKYGFEFGQTVAGHLLNARCAECGEPTEGGPLCNEHRPKDYRRYG